MLSRLTFGSSKALRSFQNCNKNMLFSSFEIGNAQFHLKSADAMDCFTNELMNRKSRKWEVLRDVKMKKKSGIEALISTTFMENVRLVSKGVMDDLKEIQSPQLDLDLQTLSQPQLDNLLLSTLKIKNKVDFLYFIRQCIEWKRLPSHDVLISCLKYLSSLCRLQQIESLAEICRAEDHPLSKTHADLAPFRAMALWRSGSADIALSTLETGYAETIGLDDEKWMICGVFRTIAEETLTQKSEAVLVQLIKVAHKIYSKYNDLFVLACIWKQCFISEWFCDQKIASDLFENYKGLQQIIGKRSCDLSSSFLHRHNVDAVHRLIEAFLQSNQRVPCVNCLSSLFNYQYLRKDLRACAEIIKSCSELKMPLNEIQNEQFLSLLLNETNSDPKTASRCTTTAKKIPKTTKKYHYNF